MNPDESEDDLVGFGFRRGGSDKLTFRQVLYNVVMQYLKSFNRMSSKEAVKKLEAAVYFNEPGFALKKEIDSIRLDINKEMDLRNLEYRKRLGREYYRRANRAKIKIALQKWYWDTRFARVLQCLADHNLIIEAEKLTKIRMKKNLGDDDSGYFEESDIPTYE